MPVFVAVGALLSSAPAWSQTDAPRINTGSAQIQWLETFASERDDWINDIVPLKDGTYLAAGFLNRADGTPPSDWRALAVKLGADGSAAWLREYGAGGGIDAFWTARELGDGKLMFGGFTSRIGPGGINAYFALTDANGTLLKENGYGTGGYDRITSHAPTADGFIGVGHAEGQDGRDLFFIGTDKEGAELWRRAIAAPGANGALYVEPAGDGNFIVAGGTDESGDADILVLKIDARGNELWRRTIGTRGHDDVNHGLVVMPDGRIVVPGYTQSWGAGERDFMAAVLDRSGNTQSLSVYGGPGDDRVILAKAARADLDDRLHEKRGRRRMGCDDRPARARRRLRRRRPPSGWGGRRQWRGDPADCRRRSPHRRLQQKPRQRERRRLRRSLDCGEARALARVQGHESEMIAFRLVFDGRKSLLSLKAEMP